MLQRALTPLPFYVVLSRVVFFAIYYSADVAELLGIWNMAFVAMGVDMLPCAVLARLSTGLVL